MTITSVAGGFAAHCKCGSFDRWATTRSAVEDAAREHGYVCVGWVERVVGK